MRGPHDPGARRAAADRFAWHEEAAMSDDGQKLPEHDDELLGQLKQRLVDEGFPPERAESLAGALLDPSARLAGALGDVEANLERLTDVMAEFAGRLGDAAGTLEQAGDAAASSGDKAAAAAEKWREYWRAVAGDKGTGSAPPAPSLPAPVSGEAHEVARHPIRAAEHEAEHLYKVADEGESAATPAIIGGTVFAVVAVIFVLFLASALGAAYLATRGGGSGAIKTAPAFSAAELSALPTDNWITNGGSLANQRYSPLKQIDTSNVSQLKGVWHTHLRGSALAAKYSAESQPLVYQGTIYVPTGQDDVFAVDATTGNIRWQYKANLDQKISTVCCGWESRGVALGDGKVYIGQLDGNLVALDQKTGAVAWKTLVMPWQQGYSITNAPLYVDGMVITGISGAEFPIRGRLTAYDARTGKQVWRFYTIPGPGETGHETWPAKGNAWKHGGASVWQTPSVDPKLGLLYFTTGNATPDNNGSSRAGKNLFAASMVALDLKTGKLRWYYQMVHHDIWDYDAPSPTVLFDATIGGKLRHGIGEASKTGWLYLLDRTNGKPIFPTPEKPVPQNANQKTSPTQPIPSYPPFVPHTPSDQQYTQVLKQLKQAAGHPVKAIRATTMYTPFWKTPVVLTPGPQGGTNWQPSSYNPNTHMFYVCAQSGPVAETAQSEKPAKQKPGGPAQPTIGSTLTITGGFGSNTGYFTAIDVTTGRIVWQKRWTESCYAGSATTGGNLVFVGRSNGDLVAYDARNGKQLWSFQMGAGANNAPTIFRQNGNQYVLFYAGGNALAASPHGDDLWLFGLDGTLGPASGTGAGQGVGHAGETTQTSTTGTTQTSTTATAGNAAAGQAVFAQNCATCHGATGQEGNGGPNLTTIPSGKDINRVLTQVRNGGAGMPSFKGTLTDQQIADVAAYVVQNITNKK
jgi:alcohol dehydrogenase (cytochrome c)